MKVLFIQGSGGNRNIKMNAILETFRLANETRMATQEKGEHLCTTNGSVNKYSYHGEHMEFPFKN